jgi:hypothetical protein
MLCKRSLNHSGKNVTGEHRYALQSVVAYALQKQLVFFTVIG